jgi:hypothetical protein
MNSTATTILGTIAIAVLDEKLQESYNYLIPKSHQVINQPVTAGIPMQDYAPLYISNRKETAQLLGNSNQYKSFSYVNGKHGNYIIFNDESEKLESIKKGKLTTNIGISSSDAFICTLRNENLNRDFMFGEASKKRHDFVMFTVADYDIDTGIYTTLKMDNVNGKKMKVIWVKL